MGVYLQLLLLTIGFVTKTNGAALHTSLKDTTSPQLIAAHSSSLLKKVHPSLSCKPILQCKELYGTEPIHFILFGFVKPVEYQCFSSKGLVLCVEGDVSPTITVPTTMMPTMPTTMMPNMPTTMMPNMPTTMMPTMPSTMMTTMPTTMMTTMPTTMMTTMPTTMMTTMPTTVRPTMPATIKPTMRPTMKPTLRPTMPATMRPTMPATMKPTMPVTMRPTMPVTMRPTMPVTMRPTMPVTMRPTMPVTMRPTMRPTMPVTMRPTMPVTMRPTMPITMRPTISSATAMATNPEINQSLTTHLPYYGHYNNVQIIGPKPIYLTINNVLGPQITNQYGKPLRGNKKKTDMSLSSVEIIDGKSESVNRFSGNPADEIRNEILRSAAKLIQES